MKQAIVTGASKGVGFATCKLLAKNGYKVIAVSRDIQKLKKLESKNIEVYELDMTDFKKIKAFYETYKNITLDLLVNNAGGGRMPTQIFNESPENFNYAYSLNVSGPMYLSKLFTQNMQKSNNPTIIFVSSIGGKFAYNGGGNYTNAKRGIGGLVDTMRLEYPYYGIKVTEVCPGTIDTVEGETRSAALTAEDMAQTISWISNLPKHVNINHIELNHIESGRF
jgi:NADP-dependent 3-hydroxy acid dehydrogenase YdfG